MKSNSFGTLALCTACSLWACGDDGPGSADATATDTSGGSTSSEASTSSSSDGTVDDDSGTSTGADDRTRIEKIMDAMDVGMYACPDAAWPGTAAAYRSSQVLFVSTSERSAWLWNDQSAGGDGPVVTEVPFDELGPEWGSVFNIGYFEDVVTLGISLDYTQTVNDAAAEAGLELWHDFAISLAFHEGFHFLSGQSEWNISPGSRSIPYPEPWEPRYLRAAYGTAFSANLPLDDGFDLGPAAHWRSRLLSQFPQEMQTIRSYDCTEGSAEFVAAMMNALVDLGCDAEPSALVDRISEHLDEFAPITHFSGGREPYDLGVLAGSILRGLEAPGWETATETGTPPHDYLIVAGGVTATPQADDPDLQAGAQAATEERTLAAGMEIEPMLERMADPTVYRIPLAFSWIAGSFGLGGFYHLANEPNQPPLMLRYRALHQTPSGTLVDVDGLTSFYGIPHPCTGIGGAIIVTVPMADVDDAGMVYSSTNDIVQFEELAALEVTDSDGLPWLCPDVAGAPEQPKEQLVGVHDDGHGRPHVVTLPDLPMR